MSGNPRDPYLDNAKALLIILVVVGHAIERIDRGSADSVYLWIYLFHMPAFVFVSGYFSRSFVGAPRQMASLISVLVAPYVVFQTILALEDWLILGKEFELKLFVPTFSLWYLIALLVWRLAIPLLRAIKYPLLFSIVVSVLSVAAGGISQELSGARILSFLPFFTLGLITTPRHIEAFTRWTEPLWIRASIGALFAGTVVAVYLVHDLINRRWLYMYGQVEKFGLSDVENMLLRIGVLLVATTMALAFFSLVPRKRSFMTGLGEKTLQIYLLHTAIIYPLMPLIGSWSGWSFATVTLFIVLAVALTFGLGSPVVITATRWLTNPLALLQRRRTRKVDGSEREIGSTQTP